MTKAKRVHSTPPTNTSATADDPSLDLAYRRLEGRICDLDRLCAITSKLVREWHENPGDKEAGEHAATMAEITQDRMREFKTTYYEWYKAPLKDGDDYVIIPTVSRR